MMVILTVDQGPLR